MPSNRAIIANRQPWILPNDYSAMGPNEKKIAMRSCILNLLENKGRLTVKDVAASIGASKSQVNTIRKHLRYLASTQQVYLDPIGRDPIYFRNGKLAHPLLQRSIPANETEYVLKTYDDDLTGRFLTITEFSVSPTGSFNAKGGLHIKLTDLGFFINELIDLRDNFHLLNEKPLEVVV